jgi:hypothetical protein
MNRKDIINKVREIFGWNQFGIYKNAEGVEFRIDEMEVEKDIYIITPEGELPAPDGEIELEDGTKIGVMEGKIRNFMLPVMDEETEEEFDEAELEDGTKVMTDGAGFEVGQKVYFYHVEVNSPKNHTLLAVGDIVRSNPSSSIARIKQKMIKGDFPPVELIKAKIK